MYYNFKINLKINKLRVVLYYILLLLVLIIMHSIRICIFIYEEYIYLVLSFDFISHAR